MGTLITGDVVVRDDLGKGGDLQGDDGGQGGLPVCAKSVMKGMM